MKHRLELHASTLLALLLSACASAPQLETGPRTVRVEVPVTRPCIAAADAPQPPKVVLVDPQTASREQLAAALGANVYALLAYARRADAAIRACTQPADASAPVPAAPAATTKGVSP